MTENIQASSSGSGSDTKTQAVLKAGTWRTTKRTRHESFSSVSSATPGKYRCESSSSSSNPSPTKQSSSLSSNPTPTKQSSSSSSSSNPTPTKQMLSNEDVIHKTGCDISSFLKFKDWIENTIFIIRDEAGGVSHSVQSVVNLDRQAGMMDWPGSYIGCQNCKTTHTASNFGNDLLQVPWTLLKTNPVPLDIPIQVKDLATCARTAAATRFGNGAMKQFMRSIIQNVRQHYICPHHSEYISIVQPSTAQDTAGINVLMEAEMKCEEPDTSCSESTFIFNHNKYLLTGKPDVACVVDQDKEAIVFCVEGKKEPLSATGMWQLESSKIGQMLFYLVGYCLDDILSNKITRAGHLGLYLEGQKGIICWSKITVLEQLPPPPPPPSSGSSGSSSSGSLPLSFEIVINISMSTINLLSGSGLRDVMEYIFNTIQKSFDE